MTQKVVLATGNQGKVRELSALLADLPFQVVPQSDYALPAVAETGSTFVENAIIKARHAAQLTGLPAIADDSGLAVDALQGAPGVRSARYAGDEATDLQNWQLLLENMQGQHARQARFICVLVMMRSASDPTPIICQGQWQGEIATAPCGDQGFGYDPVFWLPAQQCCAAELSAVQKNTLSHRAQALTQLRTQLNKQG